MKKRIRPEKHPHRLQEQQIKRMFLPDMIQLMPEYLLPAPLVIITTIEKSLLVEIGYTAGEALCGFIIASALAFFTTLSRVGASL